MQLGRTQTSSNPVITQDSVNSSDNAPIGDNTRNECEESKDSTSPDSLMPKISLMYSQIKYVDETAYYRTYEAISKTHNGLHTIRVLPFESAFYKSDPNRASTLFV